LERALVEPDAFALVEAGLRVRLALPFELVRELDRLAEPPLLELEDALDAPLRLGVFLRVFVVVWAMCVSLGVPALAGAVCGLSWTVGPAYGRAPWLDPRGLTPPATRIFLLIQVKTQVGAIG
jgi:hypothetical protein